MKRPRYVKQRDQYSCGVIAVINLFRWAGYNDIPTRTLRKALASVLGMTKDGTPIPNMLSYLEDHPFLQMISSKTCPTTHWLDRHLRQGRAVLLVYQCNDRDELGHYVLCTGKQEDKYIIINDEINGQFKTVSYQPRNVLERKLRRYYQTLGVRIDSAAIALERKPNE